MPLNAHLLVLVHGMWGYPEQFKEMVRKIEYKKWKRSSESGPTDYFHLLVATTNVYDCTYDGVDHGGERIAEEILKEVARIKKERFETVTKFSITGYGLGGLISRYAIGVLHQRKFFENVTPVNFCAFATPHIGLPRYPHVFSTFAHSLGPKFLSRTGEQIFLLDKWPPSGRPLLDVMADPDQIFYQALDLFTHKTIYANAINDHTVPYMSAAIEAEDPFLNHAVNGIDIQFKPYYRQLIKSWEFPTDPNHHRNYTPRGVVPYVPIAFPFNMIIYLSMPVLVPFILGTTYIGIQLDGRRSRKRVEEIEKSDSYSSMLINAVSDLERRTEDQVTDIIDVQAAQEKPSKAEEDEEDKRWIPCSNEQEGEHARFCSCRKKEEEVPEVVASDNGNFSSGSPSDGKKTKGGFLSLFKHHSRGPTPGPSSETLSIAGADSNAEGTQKRKRSPIKGLRLKVEAPVLLDVQKEMIVRLNGLTNLKKERAFHDDIRDSHCAIICRGDGDWYLEYADAPLRHWADMFVF